MAKIRVRDIAQRMKVPEQDLLFKLKSIGVRVEGEDASIEAEVIQALLQGKQLPQAPQREVIMRDTDVAAAAPAVARRPRPAPPTRRQPPPPPRPPARRRSVVQKADPKIRALPERKPARPEEVATRDAAVEAGAPPPEAPAVAAATLPVVEAGAPARPPIATEREMAPRRPARRPRETERRIAELPRETLRAVPTARVVVEEAELDDTSTRRARRKKEAAEAAAAVADQPETAVSTRETITISEGMRVRDLADKLGVKAKDLMKKLFEKGVMTTVNQALEPEVAKQLAEEVGFDALVVTFEEEVQIQHGLATPTGTGAGATSRAPVITVMGHVDHGKTSLLDAIRSSKLTAAEHGGITQHIAAYQVQAPNGQRLVFLDTPGHEAFTQLRARGAKVTDIVVLVVAADDGVMPQTVEAIQHARAAKVPILVAINKMDKKEANPDRVKKELAQQELLVEDWGGEVIAVPVSAIKGDGIATLLEMIQLAAEMQDLKADVSVPAQGVVLEARKDIGRGVIATVIVQAGTLRAGQAFVSGSTWGRVRSMSDDRGKRLDEAAPSTPVEVTGFDELPGAGDSFQVVEKESQARDIAQRRREDQRSRDLLPTPGRVSLEMLFSQIKEGEIKELPVVLKADVQGSLEVLKETLQKMSTDKVKLRVIGTGVGAVSVNDVLLASASRAIVFGFNVRPERNAADLAEKEEVEIRSHTVIYELTDELRKAMVGLLEPEWREVAQGRAEVREIFKIPKIGMIAGCHVVEGVIPRSATVRLLRDNVVIHEGKISSLRRFKDDASEVRSGFDCGIGLDRFQDVKPGDMIESFSREAVRPSL
jgi:translation initiation factor IF-2